MKKYLCFTLLVCLCVSDLRGQEPGTRAATVKEVASVLDLSNHLITSNVAEVTHSNLASQSIKARGNIIELAQKVDAELAKRGLKKMDGSSFTEAYCSAIYQKSGFTFSLMAMPTGEAEVAITISNLGNVDIGKLLKIDGLKVLYAQPFSAMFEIKLSVEKSKQACRAALERDGWEWFGDTEVSFFMRKNAVRVQIMCSPSPTDDTYTMLTVSAEQLSSALPLIKDLTRIAYADTTQVIDGDSRLPPDQLLAQYRKTLESNSWKATTEQPVKIDFREHLIFRNEQKEFAELRVHTVDSLTRFDLKFMSAKQFERENQLAMRTAAEAKAKLDAENRRMENPTKIVLEKLQPAVPKNGASKQSVEFTVKSGSAQKIVSEWLKLQKADGWKAETTIDTREIGDYQLKKDDMIVSVSFADPGFIPGEVTIGTSKEFQLEFKK